MKVGVIMPTHMCTNTESLVKISPVYSSRKPLRKKEVTVAHLIALRHARGRPGGGGGGGG